MCSSVADELTVVSITESHQVIASLSYVRRFRPAPAAPLTLSCCVAPNWISRKTRSSTPTGAKPIQHTNLLRRLARTNSPRICLMALGSCPPLDRGRTKSRVSRTRRSPPPLPPPPYQFRPSRIYPLPMPPNPAAALVIPVLPSTASQMRLAEGWT